MLHKHYQVLLLVARHHQVVSTVRLLGYKLLPVPSQTITYAYFLFQIFQKPKVPTCPRVDLPGLGEQLVQTPCFVVIRPWLRIELRRSDKNVAVAMELWCR